MQTNPDSDAFIFKAPKASNVQVCIISQIIFFIHSECILGLSMRNNGRCDFCTQQSS